jgi:nucleoside-diphosphate-sugar epimerase
VRSQSKIESIQHDFPNFQNLDFAIVPDITAPSAFKSALSDTGKPFDAVIHTASPFLYKAVTDNRQFIDPAVKGTSQILNDIHAFAPGVKRVVITSSFAAVGDLAHMEKMNGRVYTEADWNPVTLEEALGGDRNTAYQGSKKFAEVCHSSFRPILADSQARVEQSRADGIYRKQPGTLCPSSTRISTSSPSVRP